MIFFPFHISTFSLHYLPLRAGGVCIFTALHQVHCPQPESFITLSKPSLEQTSNNAASNLGRNKQLSAITSLNWCAKATLISLIMNNGGGNRDACLCKFPHTVISFMLDSQNSDGTKTISILVLPLSFCLFFHVFLDVSSFKPPPFMKCEPEPAICQTDTNTFSVIAKDQKSVQDCASFTSHLLWTAHSPSIDGPYFLLLSIPAICISIVSLLTPLFVFLSLFPLQCHVFSHLFFHFSSYLCHYCRFPPIFCIRPLSPATIWFRNKYSSRILQDYVLVSSFFFVLSSFRGPLFLLSLLFIFHFSHLFVKSCVDQPDKPDLMSEIWTLFGRILMSLGRGSEKSIK